MEGGQQSDSSEHLPPPTQQPRPAPAVKEELIEEDSGLTTCTLNTDETEIKSGNKGLISVSVNNITCPYQVINHDLDLERNNVSV